MNATPVTVRLAPEQLAALDAWIERQNFPSSRPMAIRMLIQVALAGAEADKELGHGK